MFIIWFLVLNLSSPAASCEFTNLGSSQAKLEIGKVSLEVGTLSKSASLKNCRKIENFENLYAVEIFLGQAGTTKETEATHLFVFKASEKTLEKLFEHPLLVKESYIDARTGKSEKDELQYKIDFKKNSDGNLLVNIDGGKESHIVKIKPSN